MIGRDLWSWRQEQEAKAWRRWRRKWLIVIALGVLVLIGLALFLPGGADAAVGCAQYEAMGRITNVSRGYVAGYTFGKPTWFFGLRTTRAFRVGERVLVRGCKDTERQLTQVTLRRVR